MTVFMTGAGVKGGQHIGVTDDVGYKAVEQPVTNHDLHATLLDNECDNLEQHDDQEDVACPVPRVLVIHDHLPDSQNALDRPVRVHS